MYVPDPTGGTGDRLRTMEELRTALTEGQLLVRFARPMPVEEFLGRLRRQPAVPDA